MFRSSGVSTVCVSSLVYRQAIYNVLFMEGPLPYLIDTFILIHIPVS